MESDNTRSDCPFCTPDLLCTVHDPDYREPSSFGEDGDPDVRATARMRMAGIAREWDDCFPDGTW